MIKDLGPLDCHSDHGLALDFYAMALENKTHYIEVHSFEYFQLLVTSFLRTRLVYHNPAYITERTIDAIDVDIFYEEFRMLTSQPISPLSLLPNDIIFVEQTRTLTNQDWYRRAKRIFQNNSGHNSIPIVIATLKGAINQGG